MFSVGLPAPPFLYPVLDSKFTDDPLRDARQLIQAGVKILQYRAKDRSQRQIYEETRGLAEICAENRVCLIVNDHVGVALVTGASGVHLGQDDFPVLEARRLLGSKLIGISTHDHKQFTVAESWPIDYIAIGPVYSTTTKLNSSPALGISKITPLLRRKTRPVVAIGGIRIENFGELVSAGIDGIALISELYRGGDVYDNACRLLEECRKHEKV